MRVYIGIDWSEQKHAICFMNEQGGVIQELTIEHKPEGFEKLDQARRNLRVSPDACLLGLETAHNLLIDFLVDRHYSQIYVLPPTKVHSSQGRFAASGAKDDPRDARLIADILRTDQARLHVWQPDSPLIRQMRAKVSLIDFLNKAIVRQTNRLRAVLLRYYPAALEIFRKLDCQIALAFIQTYPTPQQAAQLTYADFKVFLRTHHHCQPKHWTECYARLTQPFPQAAAEISLAYQQEAVLLAHMLADHLNAKKQALSELQALYQQHPDRFIFESLPKAGDFLEPALLAKLGDDRQRYPSHFVLQAMAGTSPVTQRSGKHRSVHFRQACDHEFRNIVQEWAEETVSSCAWASAYYHQVRPSCSSNNDAYRRLANRWLAILWKLWQTRTPYDEQYHLQQRQARSRPRSV